MKSLGELFATGPSAFVGAEEFEADQRHARGIEAREIRERLPRFLQAPTSAELAARCHPRLLAAAQAWQWGGGDLFLCGPTGCGKSTAAGYLFRRLLGQAVVRGAEDWERSQWLRWHSAADVAFARRSHPLGHGDPPAIVEACNARLWFLDDAGWESDVTETALILNERYERRWPTVITTGKTRAELTAHYGAAVVRRLREAGGKRATVVDCFAPLVANVG